MTDREAQRRLMFELPESETNRCYDCASLYSFGDNPECARLEIHVSEPKRWRCPLHGLVNK